MKKVRKRLTIAFIVILSGILVSCSQESNDGYRVEYKCSLYSSSSDIYEVHVKVTGPAAKLALILTRPDTKTHVEVIDEADLIDNVDERVFLVRPSMLKDEYTLLLKKFEKERILYRKTFRIEDELEKKERTGVKPQSEIERRELEIVEMERRGEERFRIYQKRKELEELRERLRVERSRKEREEREGMRR